MLWSKSTGPHRPDTFGHSTPRCQCPGQRDAKLCWFRLPSSFVCVFTVVSTSPAGTPVGRRDIGRGAPAAGHTELTATAASERAMTPTALDASSVKGPWRWIAWWASSASLRSDRHRLVANKCNRCNGKVQACGLLAIRHRMRDDTRVAHHSCDALQFIGPELAVLFSSLPRRLSTVSTMLSLPARASLLLAFVVLAAVVLPTEAACSSYGSCGSCTSSHTLYDCSWSVRSTAPETALSLSWPSMQNAVLQCEDSVCCASVRC